MLSGEKLTDTLQIQIWTKHKKSLGGLQDENVRFFATDRPSNSQLREERAKEHVRDLSTKHQANKVARAIDKVKKVSRKVNLMLSAF